MPPRSRTKVTADRIALAEKERQALQLRKAGATYEAIAKALGYADKTGARACVQRALKETIQEPADELRRLECERLDELLKALWPAALNGHTRSVEIALGVMDRRARLLGLDAATRKIVEVITEDVVDKAIRELEEELSDAEDRSS